ncbi:MAG TPA: CrcB family protein [Allosphingosinicella sp.]|jgi:CrcB protein
MPNVLLVMLGGAVGAGLRYEVGRAALRHIGAGFPWGTLLVNLAGSLLIGVLAGVLLGEGYQSRGAWLLLAVGVLGGFTTFSAFSFDIFGMIERGQAAGAGLYVAVSVAGGLALLALGYWAARAAA